MKLSIKTAAKAAPAHEPRVGGRSFEAVVTFSFIQGGQRIHQPIEVAVPASNMLGALGRAGRLAMPELRKMFPEGKIKLKEISIEIAES